MSCRLTLATLGLISFAGVYAFAGDAYRGAMLLEKNKCTECHAVRGRGGKIGPDLGYQTSRQYTPALMASVMWNHAPKMWSVMAAHGVERAQLSEHDAEDLFAYFYSVRFFERAGKVERGKRLFVENHCIECHPVTTAPQSVAKPVLQWTSASDPIALVQAMWNHSGVMKQAFAAKQFKWVMMNAQDLTDLSVYVQSLPTGGRNPAQFWLPGPEQGKVLFHEKGCESCHNQGISPQHRLASETLTGIAAAMWNHAPRIPDPPFISVDEMRQIIAYIWEKQYQDVSGDIARGQQVFETKNCAVCHNDAASGAPRIRGGAGAYSPISMVAVLWKHGPAMLERMRKKNMPWPNLSPVELSDVTAYLNSRP